MASGAPVWGQPCYGLPIPVHQSAQGLRRARLQWGKTVGRRNHCLIPRLRKSQTEIPKVLELEATGE